MTAQLALDDGVATITMDDGKVNALSPSMLGSIGEALDGAERQGAGAVVLAGRPGRFSAGFDLGVLSAGGGDGVRMVRSGFELADRLLRFPRPVVAACTGHAVAMGSFLLLAADHRVGAAGEFKVQANEVAIGLTMPHAALALLRHRLTPPAFDRAVGLAAPFPPSEAVPAGWLDELVAPGDVVATAQARARSLASLETGPHLASKLRVRAPLLDALAQGIAAGD